MADPVGDPAAGRRRLVEIRCGFADLARKEADAAHDRVAEVRRRYDEQLAVLSRAQAALDKVATVKEGARRAYRASLGAATDRAQVEAAAVAWLREINRINGQVRVAQARLERKRKVSEALLAKVDRLAMTAEASRAMADDAFEACRASRKALGLPEEGLPDDSRAVETEPAPAAKSRPAPAVETEPAPAAKSKPAPVAKSKPAPVAKSKPAPPVKPKPAPPVKPKPAPVAKSKPAPPVKPKPKPVSAAPTLTSPSAALVSAAPTAAAPAAPTPVPSAAVPAPSAPAEGRLSTDWLAIDLRSPDAQAIVRLVRRDRATLSMLVDRLADVDPTARRSWQLLLSNFVDALAAAAIDDAFFEFPPGNAFWDLFKPDEAREVARGLAALGFRYDGLGGFADGRVPGQRDLALAVGAAGLLPVRIRFWPQAAETAELFRSVRVATDLFVAQRAPALTLGEIVRLLGRRAEQLAGLWNEWPRVRPLLFTTRDD